MQINLLVEDVLGALQSELPPIFVRAEIPRLTGGLLRVGTLANLGDDGPPFIRTRRHALYERASFLRWLHGYLHATPAPSGLLYLQ